MGKYHYYIHKMFRKQEFFCISEYFFNFVKLRISCMYCLIKYFLMKKRVVQSVVIFLHDVDSWNPENAWRAFDRSFYCIHHYLFIILLPVPSQKNLTVKVGVDVLLWVYHACCRKCVLVVFHRGFSFPRISYVSNLFRIFV